MAKPTTEIATKVQDRIRSMRQTGMSERAIVAGLARKRIKVSRSALQRFLASDAKRAADVAAGRAAIAAVPVGADPLATLEQHVALLHGRLAHAAEHGTTNEHIRAFRAVAEAIQELEAARLAKTGNVVQFKSLPELLAAAKRNDDALRRKDPVAWLQLQLPELAAVLTDMTEACARVADPGARNFTGDLPTLAGRAREQLGRLLAALEPAALPSTP